MVFICAGLAALAGYAAPSIGLSALGFTGTGTFTFEKLEFSLTINLGIAAGSVAAGVQSAIGSVAAGSAFAAMQSGNKKGATVTNKITVTKFDNSSG